MSPKIFFLPRDLLEEAEDIVVSSKDVDSVISLMPTSIANAPSFLEP
jgi:hypothetical protein